MLPLVSPTGFDKVLFHKRVFREHSIKNKKSFMPKGSISCLLSIFSAKRWAFIFNLLCDGIVPESYRTMNMIHQYLLLSLLSTNEVNPKSWFINSFQCKVLHLTVNKKQPSLLAHQSLAEI